MLRQQKCHVKRALFWGRFYKKGMMRINAWTHWFLDEESKARRHAIVNGENTARLLAWRKIHPQQSDARVTANEPEVDVSDLLSVKVLLRSCSFRV